MTPEDLAKTFGDPAYVVDRRALPHPGRGRRGRRSRWPRRSPARSPSSRAWPGATRSSGPARRSASTGWASRSTASTPSPPPGTASTRGTGYTTVLLGHRPAGPHAARPGLRRRRGRSRAGGVVIGQVNDVADPEKQGRVKLQFPWLADDYVSDWARTVQPGPARTGAGGAARGRRRGAGLLRAGRLQPAGGARRPVQRGRHHALRVRRTWSTAAPGAVNRRSLVSRLGHRIDLLDEDGKTRASGSRPPATSCWSTWTTPRPRSPCTPTARC